MVVERLPGQHHVIFSEVDGNFPNHHPDPTVEKNLADLKQLVADKQLDFGIAFDGDGDRIGAVDGNGRVIWGDQLMLILAEAVVKERPGATIIADVKASQTLFDRVAELGGKPLMWKTGHSLIKSKMKETGAPLAGEMSGHIFFKHRWYGFDDALYAAVRLIEAVSGSGRSLTEIMESMPKSVATPELRFQVDEVRKFAIVEEVRDRLDDRELTHLVDLEAQLGRGDGFGHRLHDLGQAPAAAADRLDQPHCGVKRVVEAVPAVLEEDVAAHLAGERSAGLLHLRLDQAVAGFPHQRLAAELGDAVEQSLARLHVRDDR